MADCSRIEDAHTLSQLTALFRERGIRPNRRLGQNFLIDQNLLSFIARQCDLGETDGVLDVGCGTGLLTRHLAEHAGYVWGVEPDRKLAELCREYLAAFDNVEVLHQSVFGPKDEIDSGIVSRVRTWLDGGRDRRFKVICNIPYCITAPLLGALLEGDVPFERLVLTVQREVADRLKAAPGRKEYSALSVLAQTRTSIEVLRVLPPDVFWPRPKVESAIIRLTPRTDILETIADVKLFRTVTRALFQHRRKKIANALAGNRELGISPEDVRQSIASVGIAETRRGDSLSVGEIVSLSNAMARKG